MKSFRGFTGRPNHPASGPLSGHRIFEDQPRIRGKMLFRGYERAMRIDAKRDDLERGWFALQSDMNPGSHAK